MWYSDVGFWISISIGVAGFIVGLGAWIWSIKNNRELQILKEDKRRADLERKRAILEHEQRSLLWETPFLDQNGKPIKMPGAVFTGDKETLKKHNELTARILQLSNEINTKEGE